MRPEELPHVDAARLTEMIDPARTAILVVDVQVDFASPEGVLGRRGIDMAPAGAAIDNMAQVLETGRRSGMAIGFIQVETLEDAEPAVLTRLYERKGRLRGAHAICRAGTPGMEPYRLIPQSGDFVVRKRLYDSFHETDLLVRLKERAVETLIVIGLTTDCCVDQTVRSGFHRGFDMFVVSDACAAYSPALHVGALNALEKNCAMLVHTAAWASAIGAR